jgi:glycosyltransferase involved in cell wall biosynthesis
VRVIHLIHDLRPGGAEHVLVDLASVAASAGIEFSVVSMLPVDEFEYADRLSRAGIGLETLGLAGWWDPRGSRRLRQIVREQQPDILHSHLKHADVVAGRVAVAESIPHVSTLHLIEDDPGWLAARKRDVAMRSRARTAARTVAVSDAVRDWYLDESSTDPASVVTIRNGVPDPGVIDVERVGAIRRDLGIADNMVLALMVAVMRPGKGHDVLLDAVPLVRDDSVVFALAGDGACATRLQTRAAGDDRVQFLGFRHDVDALLGAADVVVHPSWNDALPTALVHALAAGRPIVATDVGGIPEIIAEGGGALVAPGDPQALASAIDHIASDDDGRRWMGKRNRERYNAEFRADVWVQRLQDLYVSLIGRS